MSKSQKAVHYFLWIMAYISLAIGLAKYWIGGADAMNAWTDSIYRAYFLAMLYDVWCRYDN